VIIGQKIYFTAPLEKKMEDMEFLKALLAKMNANMETNQEWIEAIMKETMERQIGL
jgi:hypothetical protein